MTSTTLEPVGGEVQVNSYLAGTQSSPAITALAGGGYVVTWQSYEQDGDDWGIYSQRYDASGAAVGAELRVNTTTTYFQTSPSVAGLADGGYVVTWTSPDANQTGIFEQRYDATGAAVGGEVRVNTYTLSAQTASSVAALSDGGYVVSWASLGQDGDYYGIYSQRYTASGTAVGGEVQVNTFTAGGQVAPSLAGLSDGGYVVVWASSLEDGSGDGVYSQRYDAAGAAVGGEVQVNTYTDGDQSRPSVTSLTGGGYVVTWFSQGQDGDGYGVYAQRYDASGVAEGGEVQVNTYTTGDQLFSSVSALSDGGYVITWTSADEDGSGAGVYSQRYDSAGSPVGGEVQVNTYTEGDQTQPSVAGLADGTYVVAWASYFQEGGDGVDIYAQRYGHPISNVAPAAPADSDTTTADSLRENALAGAAAGITAHSVDQDGDAVTYSLVDSAGGRFTIDSATGQITATGSVPIDYETALVDAGGNHYYEVQARASDGAANSDTTTFRIYVTNEVEHLFTAGNDGSLSSPVNFNTLADGAYDFDAARYLSGDGNDFVILPNTATVDAGNPWDFAQKFNAGAGNDVVQGGSGNDIILGGLGNDRIFGGAGSDTLDGGGGSDVLVGGAGADRLTGGAGSDVFVFLVSELGTTKTGPHDIITDFAPGTDHIDISALYTSHAVGSIKAGKAVDAQTLSGYKVEYFTEASKTYVIGDTDGVAGADFTLELTGSVKLKATDFLTTSSGWPAPGNGTDYGSLHHEYFWS